MKVLHISRLGGGGRERRMVQLVRGLDTNDNFNQFIITFDKEIGYKEILETRAQIRHVTTRDKKEMWKQICSILSDIHPDIVHLWEEEPRQVFPVLWMKHKLHFKFIAGFVSEGNYVKPWSKVDIINRLYFSFSDKIISNSLAGLKAKYAPTSKSVVIYNGFDYRRLIKEIDLNRKRSEFSISTKYVVMMCARFTVSKDYYSFLRVAELAMSDEKSITFLAIGSGPLLEESRKIARNLNLNNVLFIGQRADVEEFIKITDVSMLLTNASVHAEGISNSIMESMAAGVPVIATNGGGTPEIIIDKENGYMVEPNDYKTTYDLLINLLEDNTLRSQMGHSAINQIKSNFLLSRMTEKYIDVYNQLMKK